MNKGASDRFVEIAQRAQQPSRKLGASGKVTLLGSVWRQHPYLTRRSRRTLNFNHQRYNTLHRKEPASAAATL